MRVCVQVTPRGKHGGISFVASLAGLVDQSAGTHELKQAAKQMNLLKQTIHPDQTRGR